MELVPKCNVVLEVPFDGVGGRALVAVVSDAHMLYTWTNKIG